VVAVEPAFSDELVGRALVAAHSADIPVIIVLNKADLLEGLPAARQRTRKLAEPIDIPVVEISAVDVESTRAKLLPLLHDRTTLLLGQSGMGKSTILNTLVPDANAHTQEHSI